MFSFRWPRTRAPAKSHVKSPLELCRQETEPLDKRTTQWKICVAELLRQHHLPFPSESQHMTVAMQPVEANALLDALLKYKGLRNYVEWGSGGSTELVAWLALSKLVPEGFRAFSTESSSTWMRHMLVNRSRIVAHAARAGLLTYRHGNFGPTKSLGFPVQFNGTVRERHMMYEAYVSLRAFGQRYYDVVLIDGRFRVACAIEALRYVCKKLPNDSFCFWWHSLVRQIRSRSPSMPRSTHRYIRANSTVLIHDTAAPMFRERYALYLQGVAPFYQIDIEQSHGSLSMFRPRPHALAFSPDVHLKHLIHALRSDAR